MTMTALSSITPHGFIGGIPIGELQASCSPIPKERGVYLVMRDSSSPVQFLEVSTGAHLGGRNPAVPLNILAGRWVAESNVIYIGKAGGLGQRTTLHGRIRSYVEYGLGKKRTHWGGRYIWQLSDAKDLRLYWAVCADSEPSQVESSLIREFEEFHGRLPFANLRR